MAPAPEAPRARLRGDLPFRRIAVVLAGGGALGAYEAGVLKVLGRAGLVPAILAGTSAGAMNAAIWLAHGFDTESLERTWRGLRPASIGMRWTTLSLRALGGLLLALGVLEAALTLLGSPDITLSRRLWGADAARHEAVSVMLDALAWGLVAGLGALMAALSHQAEDWLAALESPAHPEWLTRWLGRAVIAGGALHLVTWGLGVPWPHRFSATVLAVGALFWFATRPGVVATRLRRLLTRIMPETRGRGLWRGGARRRLVEGLVAGGDPSRLTSGPTLLVVTALAVDNGRIAHFVGGPDPGPAFRERIEGDLGEVIRLTRAEDMLDAIWASSAIPLMFEPVTIREREFVDAGQYSNQPLSAVRAAEADAAVIVLLAPTGEPPAPRKDDHLMALASRLIELAQWRSLKKDLRDLSPEWSEDAAPPRRLVLVAPEAPLPGGLLTFEPDLVGELLAFGERDATRALAAAGWLDREPEGPRA